MSNIKVVDVNNEEVKQEEPTEQIEEAKEETKNEVVEEAPANEQETKTEEVEEVCKEVKPVKAQDKLVRCPKCNKEMKLKSYRYGHEKTCGRHFRTEARETIFKAKSQTKTSTNH